jgi:hypothetical protein
MCHQHLTSPTPAPRTPPPQAPPNIRVSHGTTTGRDKPKGTMARSPVLAADEATKGKYGDVTERAAGRWTIGVEEVRLLSPQHHLLKSEQD